MSYVLRLENLAVGHGKERILEDIGFEVLPGELWCLIGPNGAGKTTLLRTLLGELRPLAGGISLHPRVASRERMGFVPQRCALNRFLPTTVGEFVGLGTVGLRLGRAEAAAGVRWALERVSLDGREGADYWSLSEGQRQRCLVARALVRRPALLLADEPTAGFDLVTTEGLLGSLRALCVEGELAALLTLHDVGAAARCATHAALCVRGRVVAGPVETVLRADHLREAYGVEIEVRRGAAGEVSVVSRAGSSPR